MHAATNRTTRPVRPLAPLAEKRDFRPIVARFRVGIFFASAFSLLVGLIAGNAVGAPKNPVVSEFIAAPAPSPSSHAGTIVETPQGGLVAAWFGGTKERAPDVVIWVSRREGRNWTKPVEVANGVQPDGRRFACWNPVLFQPESGPLLLFYKVGPSPSAWWGMLKTSDDGGRTWSEAKRLPKGVLGPIKNKPLQLKNGDLLCPSSVESAHAWRVRFERTTDLGKTWSIVSPSEDKPIDAIQPSVLVHPDGRLQALVRTKQDQVGETWSKDAGQTWSPVTLTGMPNPNSGIDAVTLHDGRFLLVNNHTVATRSPLDVLVSPDGRRWFNVFTLENGEGEFSYPACIQTRDGLVHFVYTWKRERIKHVALDPALLQPWAPESVKATAEPSQPYSAVQVPGVVIDHSPASTGRYVGSPTIAVLPNGDYVAAHDFFGPKADDRHGAPSVVFRSTDRGKTWTQISSMNGAFWSLLFVHRGALYFLGADRCYGNIVIRRSDDGGVTWTSPKNRTTGILRDNGQYHCAPTPILVHDGRLWRCFERRDPPEGWGTTFRAGVISAPIDADLLHADSWTSSEFLPSDRAWNGHDMGGWLEGNAVAAPDGSVVDVLRPTTKLTAQKAAIVHISADGKHMSFDPATGFVDCPGAGQHKFTIRFDPQTKLYWALTNPNIPEPGQGPSCRNRLALISSPDLRVWTMRSVLLSHPDPRKHAFQYVDWLFDGDDIIVVSRTAYDDGLGGAHNFHDANYMTFHRVSNFRSRTMNDAPLNGK